MTWWWPFNRDKADDEDTTEPIMLVPDGEDMTGEITALEIE